MKDNFKVNLIGVYLLAFMIVFVAIPVSLHMLFQDWGTVYTRSLVYISSAGGLGGLIYCFRGFHMHLAFYKDFDLRWAWWYIFTPLLSILMGVFVYFMIVGGVMAAGMISPADYSKGIMFYCAIAFLAGFSFKRTMAKMKEIAATIFSTKGEESDKEGKP